MRPWNGLVATVSMHLRHDWSELPRRSDYDSFELGVAGGRSWMPKEGPVSGIHPRLHLHIRPKPTSGNIWRQPAIGSPDGASA